MRVAGAAGTLDAWAAAAICPQSAGRAAKRLRPSDRAQMVPGNAFSLRGAGFAPAAGERPMPFTPAVVGGAGRPVESGAPNVRQSPPVIADLLPRPRARGTPAEASEKPSRATQGSLAEQGSLTQKCGEHRSRRIGAQEIQSRPRRLAVP
jgi:hypothetical protein